MPPEVNSYDHSCEANCSGQQLCADCLLQAVPDLQDAEVTGSLATDYLGSAPMAEQLQDMLREENSLAAQLQVMHASAVLPV